MPPALATLGFFAFWWAAGAGVWLVLTDTVATAELVTGAVAATLGALCATVVRTERVTTVRVRPGWLLRAWRPLWQAVPDTGTLLLALWRALVLRRPVDGAFRVLRFAAEPVGSPLEAGRHVLAETAGSFAPNTYVVGIDTDNGIILVHQLVPTPGDRSSGDPLGLGA